jgi:hypothetical protein
MRFLNVATNVSGACVVYVVMAACSGASSTALVDPVASSPGAGSSSGSGAGGDTDSGSGGVTMDASNDATAIADTSSSNDGPVPDANAQETSTSGTRLKAVRYVGSDGSKQFAHWIDTARGNEVCAFGAVNAADDTIRCLPFYPNAQNQGQVFADSKCTILGIYTSCTSPLPSYLVQYETDAACGFVREHIFPAVQFTGPMYSGSTASCFQIGALPAGSIQFKAGTEIPAAAFVQAALVPDP